MKALLINGSPRKKFNTFEVLESAMNGAQSAGADTELIHLYDLQYKGCMSCFACKLKNSKTNGICAMKDDLRAVLEKAYQADVLILGAPNYCGNITGMMRCFLERLTFPIISYDLDETGKQKKLFLGKKQTAFIYTMNTPENIIDTIGVKTIMGSNAQPLRHVYGNCEELYICNTYQFKDYSRYAASLFNEANKKQYRDEHFPIDLQNAFDLGKRLVEKAMQ